MFCSFSVDSIGGLQSPALCPSNDNSNGNGGNNNDYYDNNNHDANNGEWSRVNWNGVEHTLFFSTLHSTLHSTVKD